MNVETRALVEYRLVQAEESLAAAKSERTAGRLRDAINRAYYAMFYAGLALLASRGFGASKHSGLVAKVSEEFIKSGPLRPELGRALNLAFDLRQKADYREFFEPTAQQADELLAAAAEFVSESRRVLGVAPHA